MKNPRNALTLKTLINGFYLGPVHLLTNLLWVITSVLSINSFAQTHSKEDFEYMSKTFDGAWVISASKETIRLRIEPTGISLLVNDADYFRGAVITDINKEENAITFEFDNQQFSITKTGPSYIKFGISGDILVGERARRLSKQDHDVLDIWYKFEPNPCGNFNQFCEESE
ncbi:MAG TPA: hypothetical protein VL995_20760 [Cellvibrio sp.]|nr:hypothetical protein [Cellvibrio sp.]